jgi:hypothetical protein
MLQWMVHVLVVSLILAVAAFTAGRGLRLRQQMTRCVPIEEFCP